MKNESQINEIEVILKELRKSISIFEYNNKRKPIVFVDKNTMNEIDKSLPIIEIPENIDVINDSEKPYRIGQYMPIKVVCDNTLKFGEIKLK